MTNIASTYVRKVVHRFSNNTETRQSRSRYWYGHNVTSRDQNEASSDHHVSVYCNSIRWNTKSSYRSLSLSWLVIIRTLLLLNKAELVKLRWISLLVRASPDIFTFLVLHFLPELISLRPINRNRTIRSSMFFYRCRRSSYNQTTWKKVSLRKPILSKDFDM